MMTATLATLLKQLQEIADHADGDIPVRINGEFVEQLTVVVQNPLASVLKDDVSYKQLENDRGRSQVIDLVVNGREAPRLPVREYDMRTWGREVRK